MMYVVGSVDENEVLLYVSSNLQIIVKLLTWIRMLYSRYGTVRTTGITKFLPISALASFASERLVVSFSNISEADSQQVVHFNLRPFNEKFTDPRYCRLTPPFVSHIPRSRGQPHN